jgi:hypothetical protein
MLHGVSLTGYLQLLDWSRRLVHPDKVNLAASVPSLLARLNIEPSVWQATLEKAAEEHQEGRQLLRNFRAVEPAGYTARLPVPQEHHRT